jgi:hypothetical protein
VTDRPEFIEGAFFAAHRAVPVPAFPDADPQDAVQVRARTLPRHRARRRQWKPPLEAVQAQHAYDRDALVG